MNWLLLSAETPGVIRDENGVPIEWTLLKIGENNFCQHGKDGVISLSAEGAGNIIQYHNKKGELIPVDSEHYLFELAEKHKLDACSLPSAAEDLCGCFKTVKKSELS